MKKFKTLCLLLGLTSVLTACAGRGNSVREENEEKTTVTEKEDIGQQDTGKELEEYLPRDFVYSSSAGDWYTLLTIEKDLTVQGHFYCSAPGDCGENYAGRIEECFFSGEFGNVVKESDTKYSLTLENMEILTPQEEKITDGVLRVGVSPHGLEESSNFELYLPATEGKDVPDMDCTVPWLPNDVESSWNPNETVEDRTIGCYELFNKDKNYIFTSDSREPSIFVSDGVLAVVDLTTNMVHSPFCETVAGILPENRKLIIAPHFGMDSYGYTYDVACAWG